MVEYLREIDKFQKMEGKDNRRVEKGKREDQSQILRKVMARLTQKKDDYKTIFVAKRKDEFIEEGEKNKKTKKQKLPIVSTCSAKCSRKNNLSCDSKEEYYHPNLELVNDEIPVVQNTSISVPCCDDNVTFEISQMKENETKTSRDVEEDVTKRVDDVENGYLKSCVPNARVTEENADPALDSEVFLLFYILDAYEQMDGLNKGMLYRFGKVKTGTVYHSCCVVVKNMQRCVYAIPKGGIFKYDEITKLEEDAEESRISATAFRSKLQDMACELKTEIANHL